jgi:hypothetical protein
MPMTPNTWTPTCQLRFFVSKKYEYEPILQQLWVDTTFERSEWRKVPSFIEVATNE